MTREDFLRELRLQHPRCWFPSYFEELVLPPDLAEHQLATIFASAVRPQLPPKRRDFGQLLVDFKAHAEYHAELRQAYKTKLDRVVEGCLLANALQSETEIVDPWA